MDIILDFNCFSFSNCNINPNPTNLPKHQTLIISFLSAFICRILLSACAYGMKSEISLDAGDSASNAVVKGSVCINQRSAECVCLYIKDFVSAGKNIWLLYVTVCKKVVPRLNKHDDVIMWNFMNIAPPEMKSWLRPCLSQKQTNK